MPPPSPRPPPRPRPGQVRPSEEFDTDNEEHMKWVYERALERAKQYGIQVRAAGGGGRCGLGWLVGEWLVWRETAGCVEGGGLAGRGRWQLGAACHRSE